jgi:dynein heavy chain
MTNKIAQDQFKIDFYKLLDHLAPKNERLRDKHVRNLVFGDYGKPDNDSKIYDEITDLDELAKIMDG